MDSSSNTYNIADDDGIQDEIIIQMAHVFDDNDDAGYASDSEIGLLDLQPNPMNDSVFHPLTSDYDQLMKQNSDVCIVAVSRKEEPERIPIEDFRNMYIRSNSPYLSSVGNSNNSSDTEIDACNIPKGVQKRVGAATKYRKITYDEIERSLSKYYDKDNKFSNEIDILATYIRGQKHLYSQSCDYTMTNLRVLTFTAMSLTAIITIITPFVSSHEWSDILISGTNAVIALLIGIIKYLKLESSSSTYQLVSTAYEKMETTLEFANNKLGFLHEESEQTRLILEKIQEIEFKVCELRELCPVPVPEKVKHMYPIISNTNIFQFMRRMDAHRKSLIMKFKDIKNEIRYILHLWNNRASNDENDARYLKERTRLLYLMEAKERTKNELVNFKQAYGQMDELFSLEITHADNWAGCFWPYAGKVETISSKIQNINPIVLGHLKIVTRQ